MMDNNIFISYQLNKGKNSNRLSVEVYDYGQQKTGGYFLNFTNHSNKRIQQRGISEEMICLAMDLGECTHKQGLAYYTVSERNRKQLFDKQLSGKLKNLVVVMDDSTGTLVTCYKNKNAFKNIAKKKKYLN